MLPNIDQHKQRPTSGLRPQSASKQSAASFAGSQKKGPIKAFEPMEAPDKELVASDSRFDKIQVDGSKLSERPTRLDPLKSGDLPNSNRKSGASGTRSKSSQKMLSSQRGPSKGDMRLNGDGAEEAKEAGGVIPPPTPPPKHTM